MMHAAREPSALRPEWTTISQSRSMQPILPQPSNPLFTRRLDKQTGPKLESQPRVHARAHSAIRSDYTSDIHVMPALFPGLSETALAGFRKAVSLFNQLNRNATSRKISTHKTITRISKNFRHISSNIRK